MGVCCLHLCQESPNYGEKMASADLMEEDSTESFVEISDYDEILREEEQLQQQLHGEQSEENYGHKLAISPDVTCDCEIPVTPVDKGPAYREGILHEATDPAKITDHQEETPQSNTEDGPENSPEDDSSNNKVLHTACDTLGPGADVVQDIPAEPDTETANEGNPETQTVCDGYRSPGESIIDKSQHEEEASNEKTLASDNPELHSTETDKGASSESELQEENGQKSTCREESGSANRKEKMQDAQETKEVKKEQHDAQDEETQGSKDDALKGQKTHEDQEQPANKRCICEEQSLVIPRLDTTGHNQSSSLWSSRVDGVVSLRMEASGPAARRPLTVAQFFSEAVLRHGQKVALCVREADKWKKITYSEYGQQSRAVARGFLKLGLQRFRAVLILGSNSPEWFVAAIGAILAGGLAVGIDPSSTVSTCLQLALDSQAQIVLVDDHKQWKKILQIQEKLPTLKAVIQWRRPLLEPCPGTYTWNQLLDLGTELEESHLDEVTASQKPNQSCAIMYSMAGERRGAMISHDNVTWTSWAVKKMLGLGSEVIVVSYLTLTHMSVQMFDLWLPLSCGGTTYFAESDAQTEQVFQVIQRKGECGAGECGAGERERVERKSVERKSVERKSVERKSVERKSVERKSVERKSVERKSVERKSVERKSVERKSVERKSVERESVERESVERESVERESVERESVERESVERESVEREERERWSGSILRGSLVSTLRDVHPTIFMGFPGLWEKVHRQWILVEKKATPLQKMTIGWARTKGLVCYTSSSSLSWGHSVADRLVFRPARMALGLDRCTHCYVGMEPISHNVVEYFGSLGIDLLSLSGKNETSGIQSAVLPSSKRTGRTELAGCKSCENEDGFGLCLWGRHIFLGYLGKEQATSEAFTEDGWFITGHQQPLKMRQDVYEEL
ncbi:long-chain-fatty-acid--CoA ligase ACSBG2-like [Anomaloglossus baeobatrachus]